MYITLYTSAAPHCVSGLSAKVFTQRQSSTQRQPPPLSAKLVDSAPNFLLSAKLPTQRLKPSDL